MKKAIIMLLAFTIVFASAGCTNSDKQQPEKTESSGASGITEQSTETESVRLTEQYFGSLYSSSSYSITTDMTVKSNYSPTESSLYHLTIAVDNDHQQAMLQMDIGDHDSIHIIIKDQKSYKLDDQNKTYTVQKYEDTITSFAKIYTEELYLGITEPLELIDYGEEKSDDETLHVEKYRMTETEQSDDTIDSAYVTYYYKDKSPYKEVLETANGNTTFIFKEINKSISDQTIFKIPSDYQQQ